MESFGVLSSLLEKVHHAQRPGKEAALRKFFQDFERYRQSCAEGVRGQLLPSGVVSPFPSLTY